MRLEYYFRETAAGLRRNGVVAFAAMSTAFIALFLFGLAVLIGREFSLVIDSITGNVQVAVYLSEPVNQDTIERVQTKLQELPAVADGGSIEYWDRERTCLQADKVFANIPAFQEGVDCNTLPTSFRINLGDTSQYAQIPALLGCVERPTQENPDGEIVCSEPGVEDVNDFRAVLERLTTITKWLRIGVTAIAVIMLASAIALVANTLRMGMFARRREIGIMRLVGATNWRIRVPFLIEGLVEAMVGAAAAIVALFLFKVLVVDRLRGAAQFIPLVRNADVMATVPWILFGAVLVAVIAGTIGMRRFLDV